MRSWLLLASLLIGCGGSTASTDVEAPAPATPGAPSPPTTPAPGPAPGTRPGATSSTYFPTATAWETVDAATAGFDAAKLDELATFVEERDSSTFAILWDGRLLLEKYWGADASTLRDVASAQKSVVSLLVGIGVGKGLYDVDDTVTSVAGVGWSNASPTDEAAITMRHLVTMTSGLNDTLERVDAPGTVWRYNTNGYHCAEAALQAKTGLELNALTRSWLFDPIGIVSSVWTKRAFQKDGKGQPINALEMTARDMARVGLLVMADGSWNGTRVVESSWLASALTTSQPLNPSYGFLFWLNGKDKVVFPTSTAKDGPLVPSAPADLVAALGANDQKIYVSRSEKLVVVRQGKAAGTAGAAATPFDEELWSRLVAAKR